MSKKVSMEHYLGINQRRKMNCAQAVMAGFTDKFSIGEDALASLASCGGGRAPHGKCGALHAAEQILIERIPEKVIKLNEIFLDAAGSSRCMEIKALKKLSCMGCVEKAAGFLDSMEMET